MGGSLAGLARGVGWHLPKQSPYLRVVYAWLNRAGLHGQCVHDITVYVISHARPLKSIATLWVDACP